jgi:predicted anti-sigma-YlaC factor YlaD
MTRSSDCEKLDPYLAGDLSGGEVVHFESHVEECTACRDTIDEQQWIEDLLQSPARIQLERTPATILDSVHVSLAHRRRMLQAACGFAAAAVLLIAVGWLALNRQATRPAISKTQDVAVSDSVHAPAPAHPQATFVSTADSITVPLESPSADVTVVQVYPTTDAERRWRLELTLTSTSTKPNGG